VMKTSLDYSSNTCQVFVFIIWDRTPGLMTCFSVLVLFINKYLDMKIMGYRLLSTVTVFVFTVQSYHCIRGAAH